MLLDTSGLLCMLHGGDPRHEAAVAAYRGARVRLTHNYVLAELVALAHARGLSRIKVLEFVALLSEGSEVEVVWVDEVLHQDAVGLLVDRLDKTYSLCDAVSFVLMRRRGIDQGLTTDRHFEQEGFRKLLDSGDGR